MGMDNLISLDLSQNDIAGVARGVFKNEYLNEINMSSNLLKEVAEGTFADLSILEVCLLLISCLFPFISCLFTSSQPLYLLLPAGARPQPQRAGLRRQRRLRQHPEAEVAPPGAQPPQLVQERLLRQHGGRLRGRPAHPGHEPQRADLPLPQVLRLPRLPPQGRLLPQQVQLLPHAGLFTF